MSASETIQVRPTYRHILRMAIPVAVAILIPQFNILTNTLFLGYYRPVHSNFTTQDLLAASGIAGIYYLTLVMIGYGLAAGILMLMSRKAGQNDIKGVGQIFSNGIFLSALMGILLMGLSYFVGPLLFEQFIQKPEVKQAAISFIKIRIWGLPFILLCQVSNSFFIAVSQSRKIIYGSLAQTGVNILFDYLLIFGIGQFPEMGIEGTAVASVLSEVAFLLVSYTILRSLKIFRQYALSYFSAIDLTLLKHIFIKSSPLIVQYFLSIGAWEVFFIFVEHLGNTESAVSQILRTVFGVVGIAAWALGSTSNAMVSNLLGQGHSESVVPLVKKIIGISLGIAFSIGIWLMLFPEAFLQLLTTDTHIIETARIPLRVVVLATWMLSVSTICFNAVLGTGNTRMNMIFEIVAIILYLFYCIIVIEIKRMPLPYAWASEFVYWLSLFLMSAGYLKWGGWKKNAVIKM